MTEEPFLSLTNVCKGYGSAKQPTEVLRDINLEVRRGEFLAMVNLAPNSLIAAPAIRAEQDLDPSPGSRSFVWRLMIVRLAKPTEPAQRDVGSCSSHAPLSDFGIPPRDVFAG